MVPSDLSDAPSGPPVDLAVLSRLMGNPPPESLNRMLATFWESESGTPLALQKLADICDGAALAEAAHGAKGAASFIGALGAAELCRRLEISARAGDWAIVAMLMAQVENAYAEIGAFIAHRRS